MYIYIFLFHYTHTTEQEQQQQQQKIVRLLFFLFGCCRRIYNSSSFQYIYIYIYIYNISVFSLLGIINAQRSSNLMLLLLHLGCSLCFHCSLCSRSTRIIVIYADTHIMKILIFEMNDTTNL